MLQIYARIAPWLLQILEACLVVPAVFLIFLRRPSSPPRYLRTIEQVFGRLARRRTLSVLVVGVLVLAIRSALIPVLGIPKARFHDEFSYLLAADTFAHGRVTNPTHPMWVHFETFHVNPKPTYMSMYAPAQGLVLAVGERLGNPWLGQLLVTAVMCAGMTWMLQGWVSPGWALLGGMLTMLRFGILSYWMNSYWSASIVALGGALMMGAWPRIQKRARIRDALCMATGVAILANSRPYEGMIFSLPLAANFVWWFWRKRHFEPKLVALHVLLPIVFLLTLTAGAMGYYYYRVTGSPVKMAYTVNAQIYGGSPYFLWGKGHSQPRYRHAVMREFYDWTWSVFDKERTLRGYLDATEADLSVCWKFYLGLALSIPLLGLPWAVRDKKMLSPVVCVGALVLGIAVETWNSPHYFAPAAGAFLLLLVQSMRHLRLCTWKGRPVGQDLVRLVPIVCIALLLVRVVAAGSHIRIEEAPWPRGYWTRVTVIRELEREPGQKLILVKYGPEHSRYDEYVYNRADIDSSDIVWARDMGPEQNQELLNYFGSRSVWQLQPDDKPPHLTPYRGGAAGKP